MNCYLHRNGCVARWELYMGSDAREGCGSRGFLRDKDGFVRQWNNVEDAIEFARQQGHEDLRVAV